MKINHLVVLNAVSFEGRLSIDAAALSASMHETARGVLVLRAARGDVKFPPTLIPWSNIRELRVELEKGDPGYVPPKAPEAVKA